MATRQPHMIKSFAEKSTKEIKEATEKNVDQGKRVPPLY